MANSMESLTPNSYDGGWIYKGTRNELTGCGLVPASHVFPGEIPGQRSPRFRDGQGRSCSLSQSPRERSDAIYTLTVKMNAQERRRERERSEIERNYRDAKAVMAKWPQTEQQFRGRLIELISGLFGVFLNRLTEEKNESGGYEIDGESRDAIALHFASIRDRLEICEIKLDADKRQRLMDIIHHHTVEKDLAYQQFLSALTT